MGQIVSSALINFTRFLRSTLTAQKILEIVDDLPTAGTENSEPLSFPHLLPSATTEEETKGSLGTVRIDYLFSKGQQALRQMMSKHRSMRNGQLVQINTLQPRIAFQFGSRPFTHRPYRAGPTARAVIQKNAVSTLQQGVFKLAQSEWSSFVVQSPAPNWSGRFCIDNRRLNAITIRHTYFIRWMIAWMSKMWQHSSQPKTQTRDIDKFQ